MTFHHLSRTCLAIVFILTAGCTGNCSDSETAQQKNGLRFDLAEIAGPTTDHASTGGASWVDYDGDGDLDLFVTNGYDVSAEQPTGQPNRLYRNDGQGGFVAITEGALVESEAFSSGHTWADYDNDGDPDVFITSQQDQDNLLYRNEGGGRFLQIEDEPPAMGGGHSYTAGWVDVDGDGWLDLFVANGGLSHAGANALYRGTGEGHFEKVTEGAIVTDESATCGFAWGDYDNDGDPDLFVANMGFDPASNSNALYRNDGGWSFTKMLEATVANDRQPCCAADWIDIDNDQDLDLHVTTHFGMANLLYINDGAGEFEPATDSPLTLDGGHSFEANWEDYDNDGDLDLVVANWGAGAALYLNDGRGDFTRAAAGDLTSALHYAGAMASADFDADGDVDVYVANWPNNPGPGELNRMYRNRGTENHWLKVHLVGDASNRSAIGARVLVTTGVGTAAVTQMREVSSQVGFRSQSATTPHFGLGAAEKIETIEVSWPSGRRSRLEDIGGDRIVEIVEPAE